MGAEFTPVNLTTVKTLSKERTFSLVCAFAAALTMCIAFYWLQIFFFKQRFDAALKAVIPTPESLIYNMGHVRHINADRMLTYDDLNAEEFKQEEGRLALNWDHIMTRHNVPQQMGSVRSINFDHVVQMEALDPEVFSVNNGVITLDVPSLIREHRLVTDPERSRMMDLKHIVTSSLIKELYIDLKTGLVNHFSNLGKGVAIKEQCIILGEEWRKELPGLASATSGQILPLTPWTAHVLDEGAMEAVALFADNVIIENLSSIRLN